MKMPRKRPVKAPVVACTKKADGAKVDKPTKGRKRKDVTPAETPSVPIKKGKTEVKSPESRASTSKEESTLKKVKFTGKVPIDEQCVECSTGYHIYMGGGANKIYDATLNQTNIGQNNNKYFILQLLKHDSLPEYVTWFRWGRVGKVAGKALKRHGANLDDARKLFETKYKSKTGNYWDTPFPFFKDPGKYDLVKIDYGDDEDAKKKPKEKNKREESDIESKLDKRVQEVMDLIFDVKEFEACVKELEFDVKKAPLGKLTAKQIKSGYEALKKIEKCIHSKKMGKDLSDACSEFYTKIPHDFGMKVPPLIETAAQLQQKIQLLEALSDIQIAIQMIDEDDLTQDDVNIKDKHYKSLGCKLEPLASTHDDYKMVKKYITNSHGSSHNQYSLAVENVYEIGRKEDEKRFKKGIGNRMLLWHGSRLTNWCGILKQGLRIAPPEAPETGYMFGKGVYFADVVSKSANYCFASKRQPSGFLLLCEVALGETNDMKQSNYNANKLPKGKYSTKGVGCTTPDPKGHKKMGCGTVVPLGRPTTRSGSSSLMYNEYIVYDVAQIKARYLVKTKFNFRNMW